MSTPRVLTVLYDENCALCERCRYWLGSQPTHLPVEFMPAGSAAARARFGSVPWLGADLVVVDEGGRAWIGAAGFVMCLWATEQYRPWAYRLSGRSFSPLAERFFHMLSTNRSKIGAVIGSPQCPDGKCRHRPPAYRPYQ